jgi:hypothetical protein
MFPFAAAALRQKQFFVVEVQLGMRPKHPHAPVELIVLLLSRGNPSHPVSCLT